MKKIHIIFTVFALLFYSCRESNNEDSEVLASLPDKGVHTLQDSTDLDSLIQQIGNAKYVLLGEASHGTSEYYTWRATISQRLIQEKGFTIIAVEGDWPASYQVNNFIKGRHATATTAPEVLRQSFTRWPQWMWANQEVAALTEWLKLHNTTQAQEKQVGFYGLDVYSLWESMDAVVAYLEQKDPAAASRARQAYECFASYNRDEQAYASATLRGADCADEVTAALELVRASMAQEAPGNEANFNAEQNALVVVNAERYYKEAARSNVSSWNIRDRHMSETINRLVQLHGPQAKIIVWEHNTHVGDARATDMEDHGMVNVGQLVREEHLNEGVYIVGFGSYEGTVIASQAWGGAAIEMNVPQAKQGSWEEIMHRKNALDKILFSDQLRGESMMMQSRGHRAIGVTYNPANEEGNYVPTVLPERYDAFIFIDQTHALRPLQ